MIAILFNQGYYIGNNATVTAAELDASGIDYVMVDALPQEITSTPSGKRVKVISRNPLVLELEDIPAPPEPPKTPEQIRLEALEVENADVWYELMLKESRIAEHDVEIADIWYEIMTTGGTGA